jgi:phosphatidylserine decarboxylase
MRDALIVSALSVVPRKAAARAMGVLSRTGLSQLGTAAFVRAYGVDMSEAEHGLDAYPTLAALFTRRLKPGARPVDPGPGRLVSPVDGKVAWVGQTQGGAFDVAPGRPLTLAALCGASADGERDVVVIYLSPRDYHRVHAPCDGVVRRWRYLPGTLWPVFPAAVRGVTGLFGRNERVWAELETPQGPVELVMVGAFGVGRMETVFCDLLTNTGAAATDGVADVSVTRGGDFGVFHLGSTVVLVLPPGRWAPRVAAGDVVRMGVAIADARQA